VGLVAIVRNARLSSIKDEINDNSPQHREIACPVSIDLCGRFLLKKRDDFVGITHPGKVALFGGHREGEETFLKCVVRWVEELSYFIPAKHFEYRDQQGCFLDCGLGSVWIPARFGTNAAMRPPPSWTTVIV
jgi:hypothetical protein